MDTLVSSSGNIILVLLAMVAVAFYLQRFKVVKKLYRTGYDRCHSGDHSFQSEDHAVLP